MSAGCPASPSAGRAAGASGAGREAPERRRQRVGPLALAGDEDAAARKAVAPPLRLLALRDRLDVDGEAGGAHGAAVALDKIVVAAAVEDGVADAGHVAGEA